MKIYHHCAIPKADVPHFLSMATLKWRCRNCGQRWRIVYYPFGGHRADSIRLWHPNIRHFFWKHRELKHVNVI